MNNNQNAFARLLKIMDELREQCPWDKKQTIHSLRSLTIEECYELMEAIDLSNPDSIKEELGDLLLHIVFYSKIANEQNWFTVDEMIHAVCDKLILRHPHIYGDIKLETEEEVKQNWEKLKLKEGKKGILAGVPSGLPAIVKAWRMQEKTKQVGFEWEHIGQVWEKVEEEMEELKEAVNEKHSSAEIEGEFGDLIFALINYARFLKIDPERALEQVNQKFKTRFEYIEKHADRPLENMSLMEMEDLWQQSKTKI